ncbi:MAG TPA: Ig-like domain-containing protein [Trebonia sp.]
MRSRLRVLALLAGILAVVLGGAGCSSGSARLSGSDGAARPPVTGTVVVKSGDKVVCVMKVSNGKGTCKVDTKAYPPGALPLTASYSGTKQYKKSTSKTLNLRLSKPAS